MGVGAAEVVWPWLSRAGIGPSYCPLLWLLGPALAMLALTGVVRIAILRGDVRVSLRCALIAFSLAIDVPACCAELAREVRCGGCGGAAQAGGDGG